MKILKSGFLIPAFISMLIACAIFYFSLQPGEVSSTQSMHVAEAAARVIVTDFDAMTTEFQRTFVNELHSFVRKMAHFFIYLLLGASVFVAVRSIVKRFRNQFFVTIAVCAVCAALDELNQFFIPGREGSILDVVIDVSGSIFGVIAVLVVLSVVHYVKEFERLKEI